MMNRLPPINRRSNPQRRIPLTRIKQKSSTPRSLRSTTHNTHQLELNDMKVLIAEIPKKTKEIFSLGYKALFPETLITQLCVRTDRSFATPAHNALVGLNNISKSSEWAGQTLNTIVSKRGLLPVVVPRAGLPAALYEEIKINAELLRASLTKKADALSTFHTSLIHICRAAFRASRLAVSQQVQRLLSESQTVKTMVQSQARQAQPRRRQQLDGFKPEIEQLFRKLLSKYHVSYEGLLADTRIPVHSRVHQLMDASGMDLPASTQHARTQSESLPRPMFQSMLQDLERLGTQKKLASANGSLQQLQIVNKRISELRQELKKEIVRNNKQTHDAYANAFRVSQPNTLSGGSPRKAFDDLIKLSVLFQIVDQNDRVQEQNRSMDRDVTTEQMQRKGCGAFGAWFTTVFWTTISRLLHQETALQKQRFLQTVRRLTQQTDHLISELRRPKFFTVQKAIETLIRSEHVNMETRLLSNHRAVFAEVIDLCAEMYHAGAPQAGSAYNRSD